MRVKLYSRKNVLYLDYTQSEKRVRKSLKMEDTRSNVNYVQRNIIPEIERKLEYGLRLDGYKMSEFTQVVLDSLKDGKINTYSTYKYAINTFFKIMGDVDVEKIRTIDIDRYVQELIKRKLSSATISTYLAPIYSAFKEAIRLDIIVKNPVQYARKPNVQNKEKKPFTITQMHTLLDSAEGNLKTFLYFAFFTGARPNEILALTWADIKSETISINKTIARGQVNSPKNGKSREIKILKPLKDYLSTLEINEGKIISREYGTIRNNFCTLIEKHNYAKTSLHVTRHTFTSLLLQARENPTLVQYFLGHSSLNMINKVYAHYIEDEKDISRMEKALEI